MAIVKSSTLVNKSSKANQTNSQEDQMAASTTVMPRYAVFSLSGKSKKGDDWTSFYLSVSPEAPLSDKEKAALLDAFDKAPANKDRKSFDPSYFRGMTAAMKKTGVYGGELYWLAGEEMMSLAIAKNNVVEVLGSAKGKATKPQAQDASEQPKAASKGSKGKNTKGQAAQANKAKEKAAARQFEVVLG